MVASALRTKKVDLLHLLQHLMGTEWASGPSGCFLEVLVCLGHSAFGLWRYG